MNRITLLLFFGVSFPLFSIAQVFDTGHSGGKTLPPVHGKADWGSHVVEKTPDGTSSSPANFPTCAFDEMNHLHGLTDPDFLKEIQHYTEEVVPHLSEVSGLEKSTVAPLITISVVVHVIHNGEPVGQGQNLSDQQIQAQIQILNQDFASLNPQFFNTPGNWLGIAGVPNIEFCLASVDPAGNPTNGIARHNLQVTGTSWNNNNVNSSIKPATNWNPLRYFNIYVLPIPGTTSAGGVVGYSNYPTSGQIGSPQDGVVIDYRWFGAPGFGVSGWRALTHETGHYLGLPHTFNGSSCTNDDGIADTPNIDKSTRDYVTLDCATGYPTGPTSCGNQHLYVNYMDYVTENCYTSFTQGQVNVMRAVLNGTSSGFGYGSRLGLVQNAPAQCNIPAHDAGITRIITPTAVACTPGQLTPVVTLRNFGSQNLTSVNIQLKAGAASPINFAWQGSLFPGQNEDVTLPAFTPPAGQYSLSIFTQLPNGQPDQRPANDTTSGSFFTHVAALPPLWEDFEGETGFPVSTGIFGLNISNDNFEWQVNNLASSFGVGSTSAMFDNYAGTVSNNPFGTLDALVTRHYNFTNITGAQLKFNVAYAPYDNLLTDTLLVMVATGCSQNFNQLAYRKGGVQLSTALATTQPFVPSASQWRTETIDLSSFDGMDDVTLAFINLSGWGNRLYIDDIRLGQNCASITHSFNIVPNACQNAPNGCTGSATINLSNHNGSLNYQWAGQPGVNQPTLQNLCPQQVTVTVTDGFGCQVVASAMVPQSPPPALNVSSTQVTTFGGNNGTATVNITGGVSPYNFTWSNGNVQTGISQNTSTISGLAPGTYTVTVVNGNGCSYSTSVTVSSVCDNFSVNTSVSNVTCNGGTNGSVSVSTQNGTGPYTYLWSNGANTATASNLQAGTYSVTVTSGNGCPATKTATVQQPSAIVLNMSSTNETIQNAQNGTATVAANGGTPGYSYLWSNGGTTPTITGLAPGNYAVTVTDQAGCTKTGSVTVNTVSCANFAPVINSTNITCFGLNNGTASVSAGGGTQPTTFSWSNGQTNASISNLPPGTIGVTVSDPLGCSAQLSATITQPLLLTLSASATNETAANANNGTAAATAAGGNGNYQFVWNNGATTSSVTNLSPGIYSVTVTDANGCQATATANVGAFSCGMSIDLAATPATCANTANGSAFVSTVQGGAGPYQYNWSNGGNSFMITNIVAGTYAVTVSDNSGCSATKSVIVPSSDVIPPVVFTKNITVPLDADGQLTITGAMVDNGSSDNCGGVNIQVTPSSFTCANIGPNQVTVLVTDLSGNSSSASAIVTIVDQTPPVIVCPSNLTVNTCAAVSYSSPTAQDACGAATLTLTSGFASGQPFPIGATLVTWSATDAKGNTATCSFTVTVASDLSMEGAVNPPTCHGLSNGSINLSVTGGVAPYTTEWSSGGGPAGLPAGTYGVTVTDANGCTVTGSYLVEEPSPLVFTIDDTTPATAGMSNGTILFSVKGGTAPYSITWFDGNGQPIPDFNPLAAPAGTYQAIATDAQGCTISSATVQVDQMNGTSYEIPDRAITVFPNPSSGLFLIKIDLPLTASIEMAIYDLTGRQLFLVKEAFVSSNVERLDLQAFTPGVYWLKVSVGGTIVWRKVVVI